MTYKEGDMVEVLSLDGPHTHCAVNINIGDIVEVFYMNYGQTWVMVTTSGGIAYLDLNDVTMAQEKDITAAAKNLDSTIYPTYIPQEY